MAIKDSPALENEGKSKLHPEHAAVATVAEPKKDNTHLAPLQQTDTSAPPADQPAATPEATEQRNADAEEAKEEKEDKPAYLEDLEFDHDVEWMKQFTCLRIFLIVFGRWPITFNREPFQKGYVFRFSWTCPGFIIFLMTAAFTLFGLVSSSLNVIDILMEDKVRVIKQRTYTEIIEQGLVERHTVIILIMLGSYGINTLTLFFIFLKRHRIAETFTKWTRFLYLAKLRGVSLKRHTYVSIAVVNYVFTLTAFLILALARVSATVIGGPTVVTIIFARQFFPSNYLEKKFVGSSRHHLMHWMGLFIYLYIVTACHVFMFLFLWLLNSMENAFSCWNTRMIGIVEAPTSSALPVPIHEEEEENKAQPNVPPPLRNPRLTYRGLYHDHIGLVRMLSWFNSMFAYTFEPYVLFLTVKIVYQMYLAGLVMKSNGKPMTGINVGKYFVRKRDYIPPMLLTYENGFMLIVIFLASSWLEDTAYESYDVLRKHCLLNGTNSDRQSFFFLSMFQSYTSTTKMAVSGGGYFCVDRYTILHVLSAIMSNFLVVYQFSPLFDSDTVEFEGIRKTIGQFLESFEGLDKNHTIPSADHHRSHGLRAFVFDDI